MAHVEIASRPPHPPSTGPSAGSRADREAISRLLTDASSRYDPFPLVDMQHAYAVGRTGCFELGKVGIHFYEELDCVDLDLPRLGSAWQRTIDRHDMLRAVLTDDGRQRVLPEGGYRIEMEDLRQMRPEERTERLGELRRQLSHVVYDPSTWPLFRLVACRLDDSVTRLLVSIDAIHLDLGSLGLVFEDLLSYYDDPGAELPEPEASFRGYVLAIDRLQSARRGEEPADLRSLALRTHPAPALPFATAPSRLERQRFIRSRGELGPQTWDALKRRAAARDLTPSAVTLAVYAEALATWSRTQRLTVNVPAFNRRPLHPQMAMVAGNFTSLVLVSVDAGSGETFEDWARGIKRSLIRGLRRYPAEGARLLRQVGRSQRLPPDSAIMPYVFTSLLSPRVKGFRPLHRLGRSVYGNVQTPQVAMDLHVSELEGGLLFDLDYVEGLFPAGLVDEMREACVDRLHRLGDDERIWRATSRNLTPQRQLRRRRQWNATTSDIPARTLDDLFRCAARSAPDRPALRHGSESLSYGELEEVVGRIAGSLTGAAGRRAEPVAVALPKGWKQIAAVLGVVRAGAPYVPIDPGLPAGRLAHILDEVGCRVVIVDRPGDLSARDGDRPRLLPFDELASAQPAEPRQQPGPHDLAYVLYTSGSTGVPKGVMIEHRSVVNRVLDVNQRLAIGGDDRVIALTRLHHDLSVYDVFGTLAAGATLVVPDGRRTGDPAYLVGLVHSHRVTVWNSVPAWMEMVVDWLESAADPAAGSLASLRRCLLSGDWIPPTLPERIRALAPNAQVTGLGGPTETTIWDICNPGAKPAPGGRSILYGRPMANAAYHVLNEVREPCPEWTPGELFIGGAGLARGYVSPDQTREAFFEDLPFAARLYRSGDLGRYLPGGDIEILGRTDTQLKVRGRRIEAGDVESSLLRSDLVAGAAVVASGSSAYDKELVAFVVLRRQQAATPGDAAAAPGSEAADASPEAIDFKLGQPGYRRELAARTGIALAGPADDESERAIFEGRTSQRAFEDRPVPLERLGRLLRRLFALAGDDRPLPKRRYPSAGSLYPVQTYLAVSAAGVEGLDAGIYYYDPLKHRLVRINGQVVPPDLHAAHNRTLVGRAAFSLFLVEKRSAIEPLYGALARDFCLLEAGYMGQLLMGEAPACELGLCPVGDFADERILGLLDLDDDHDCLHCLVGGLPASGRDEPAGATSGSPERGASAVERRLRTALRETLPPEMIPSRFVFLDRLPLTANGKVDRRALREGVEDVAGVDATPKAPLSDLAVELAALVRDQLAIQEAPPDVPLFRIGANSLQMTRLAIRIGELVGRQVTVTFLYEHPTIRSLASSLSRPEAGGEDDDVDASAVRGSLRRRLGGPGRRSS